MTPLRSYKRYTGLTARYPETYSSWRNAKQRCRDPRTNRYEYYGGRGITFSTKWDDFADFLADMGPRPPGTSIDRIDNDKGYEPGNCRWATHAEQCANKRTKVSNRVRPKSWRIINDWFKQSGLSVAEFADLLGYREASAQNYLSGKYMWIAPSAAVRFEVASGGALNARELVTLDYVDIRYHGTQTVAFLERGVVRRTKARDPKSPPSLAKAGG